MERKIEHCCEIMHRTWVAICRNSKLINFRKNLHVVHHVYLLYVYFAVAVEIRTHLNNWKDKMDFVKKVAHPVELIYTTRSARQCVE